MGYFTLRKTIWKAVDEHGAAIGFTVVTEKRGGSVKFGPTLVAPTHRSQGIGRSLRKAAEGHYAALGFRKAYSTTHLKNIPGIYYLTAIGYRIEAHCRSHYQQGVDELILGKQLSPARPPAPPTAHSSSLLLDRLAPHYDGLDEVFEQHLFASATSDAQLESEAAHASKQKVVFGQPSGNFCVTTPKRIGAIKLGPLLATDTSGLRGMLNDVATYYRARQARKLYCIVPVDENWIVQELRLLQWQPEGTLREPYRPLCDMAILSLFLMNEGAQ
ncbi:MAG TPA: GNAT family N-acetyltransferase [Thermoanaerobaculia bacterium]|nr:GNAT family N-acetyltransferase [Thermoanaerobaculia bacterium]